MVLEALSSIAVIVASIVAIFGINAWKREFQGKRKIELGEEVLALFYEAKDAIGAIRSPFGFQGEGETRKQQENETPRQKEARDRAYAVYERFEKRQEVFNKLHSKRYQFIARFGYDKVQPFEDIRKIIIKIQVSASMLADIWCEEPFGKEEKEQHKNDKKEHQAIIWEQNKDDKINTCLKNLISDIEAICKPIIMGKKVKSWWSWLVPK